MLYGDVKLMSPAQMVNYYEIIRMRLIKRENRKCRAITQRLKQLSENITNDTIKKSIQRSKKN